MGAMAMLCGVGGMLVPIMNDIENMTSPLAAVFILSILLVAWGLEDYRNDTEDRLKRSSKK
jgi:hypothetical protein